MSEGRRVALVTGANKGIGLEIARQLAELDFTVVLGARDADSGERAAAQLRADGGDVWAVRLDVTDPASVQAAASTLTQRFGRLDVLVNNAGVMPAKTTPSETGADVLRAVYEVNVFGVVTVTNAMLPLLAKSTAPRVVNQSSSMGSQSVNADPDGAYAGLALLAYNSSKAALNAVTLEYAKEFRDTPIKINLADPGYCATDLTGNRSSRSAADGARIAVRLATLAPDGPTGTFANDSGPVPW